MIEGKDAVNVMPCALEALSKFGEHPEILYHFTALNLYKTAWIGQAFSTAPADFCKY